ncbi:hypothetical protein ACGFIK_13830 [Micromonospora sp. NPDC048871]|uniref:hypothetical protein n=1 Tax=unclassified Micromonospora TaxID=2617518 RepID=UPI002E0D79CA|nr:hypothetical protein OIE53_11825 [Micromonospora sp. NBC_01739]
MTWPFSANARQMCRIGPGKPVMFAAIVTHDLLVVHLVSTSYACSPTCILTWREPAMNADHVAAARQPGFWLTWASR